MIKYKLIIIGIDPGENTGIGIYYGNKFPLFAEIVHRPNGSIERYLEFMRRNFILSIDTLLKNKTTKHTIIVIERPMVWVGSNRSRCSVDKGDLLLLTMLCGVYIDIGLSKNWEIRLPTANQWKGNCTKDDTALHLKLVNGMQYPSDHIADAVAIALCQPETGLWSLKGKTITI